MELTLTKEQEIYLNKKGIVSPNLLKMVYKKSVIEQQNITKQAASLRKAQQKGH